MRRRDGDSRSQFGHRADELGLSVNLHFPEDLLPPASTAVNTIPRVQQPSAVQAPYTAQAPVDEKEQIPRVQHPSTTTAATNSNSTARRSGRSRRKPNVYSNITETLNSDTVDHTVLEQLSIAGYRAYAAIPKKGKSVAQMTAITAEMTQLLQQKTFIPVPAHTLTAAQRAAIIPSMMLVQDKFKDDGPGKPKVFDKTKARLVAGGHKQPANSDVSAPTVRTESVLALAAIAAKDSMVFEARDIKGAYLHATLTNKELYMRLGRTVADICVKIDSEYAKHRQKDGTIYVHLQKALYGLRESGKLWHEHISATLSHIGFKRSSYDECVFYKNSVNGDVIATVTIHVDDLLKMSKCAETDMAYHDILQERYGDHTIQVGNELQYLGLHMHISPRERAVTLSQAAYVKDLLLHFKISKSAAAPAGKALYEADHAATKVPISDYKSKVMKLMYLATRTRPDILLPVSFLATRAEAPNKSDDEKLNRVLRYLHGTQDKGMRLQASSHQVSAWADASFGVHSDGKSHTGMIVTLGENHGAVVLAKSKKQTFVTRSSTEAEFIALDQVATYTVWLRNLLSEIGYHQQSSPVHQDNKSTIYKTHNNLGKKGNMRHLMNVKYHWLLEVIQEKQLTIQYTPTEDMIPDILTKPLTGPQFIKLRDQLLNTK